MLNVIISSENSCMKLPPSYMAALISHYNTVFRVIYSKQLKLPQFSGSQYIGHGALMKCCQFGARAF